MKLAAAFFLAAATSMAAADPGRLVVIGDSITQATAGATTQNGTRSYRWELFRRLHDAGLAFDFVGSHSRGYTTNDTQPDDATNPYVPTHRGIPFDRAHEGHWSWRAFHVTGESAGPTAGKRGSGDITTWTDPAKGGYRADTATLLLGINDIGESTPRTSTQVTNDLAVIVRALQTANPAVRVHLCELLHVAPGHAQYPSINTRTDALNGLLPALGTALSTASSTVTAVEMRNAQANGWNAAAMTYDNIHPNSAGERYIGGRIAAALGAVSQWTALPLVNPDFEGGFTGTGTTACKPNGWTIFGTPNPAAVPKGLTDVSIVAESPADTGTGNAGSSYIIAGAADTGIEQTLADTLQPGRRYMLRAMMYKASSVAGPGDYGLELWAGAQRIAAADTLQPLPMYQTGATGAIGRRLKEFFCAVDSDTLPALHGQPLRVRLVSRHASRYIGFEEVRLDWRPLAASTPAKKTVYLLTGQSNSLGTTYGNETDKLPGVDPADRAVAFWWNNFADAGVSLGDSGGVFTGLRAQQGMYYGINFAANGWFPVTTINTLCEAHWGPEINFARTMHHAGRREIAVIKVSRGGGGNTLWDKASGGHMYAAVTSTVRRALTRLDAEGVPYEVAGMLYVQGESNNAAEAAAADTRFLTLLDNLRADIPNASRLRGYVGGIAISGADANTTRSRHEALAAARPDRVSYVSDLDLANELEPDNLHFRKTAKLAIGARLAHAVLDREASFNAASPHSAQPGGGVSASGFPQGLGEAAPALQGWSEEPPTSTGESSAFAEASTWRILDADTGGRGYLYARAFTASQTSAHAGLGWTLTCRLKFDAPSASGGSFFFQYGDANRRWLVNLNFDDAGRLLGGWTADSGEVTPILQNVYDGAFHDVAVSNAPGAAACDVLLDGVLVGRVAATLQSASLGAGVVFGSGSSGGLCDARIAVFDFQTGRFSVSSVEPSGADVVLTFPTLSGRRYQLERANDARPADWTDLGPPVPATSATTQLRDLGAAARPRSLYRVRLLTGDGE